MKIFRRIALLLAVMLLPTTAISEERVTVLVTQHRWHTGIVVPANELKDHMGFLGAHFDDPRWYEFGWGDSEFYRREESYWLMARAMLWPTDSVLHVVAFDHHPAEEIPGLEVEALCVSTPDLKKLLAILEQDFEREHGKAPVPLESGLYGDSLFFPANGNFWFVRTCNVWTAERLQQAGVDLRVYMTLTAERVMNQVADSAQAGACRER